MTTTDFGAELFLGRLRTDLLTPPAGDPRRLSNADEQFLTRLREFCDEHVDSHLIERTDRIPGHVIDGLRRMGAFAIKIPTTYGGLGLSGRCYLRALTIVNSAHSALGELLAAHQAIGLTQPVLLFGTDEQKSELLPRCVTELSAFALTEPDIGNDPFRMRTVAVRSGDTYTLNGVKLWTTNGTIAGLLVVMAMVEPAGGMTVFLVEAGSPGVTIEHRSSFMGLRGLENGVIRLRDVVVPAAHRIGGEGEGLTVALTAQETGRLSFPAVSAGAAKWALKIARQWSAARVQWGRPIGEHEAVAAKIAYIAATAFALEAMVEISGSRADRGAGTAIEAELAKLFAAEHTWRVADELVQLRGGRGYETAESAAARGERGVPAERLLRDVRIGRIFDGSTEALRSFIADTVLALHRAAGHTGFAADTAGRLAEQFARGGLSQRHLGRLVDVGAELYAMSAARAYAQALDEDAGQLADTFCRQAQLRIDVLMAQLRTNTDAEDSALARAVLDGGLTWLEEGVIDPSIDGPWIAEPQPGGGPPPLLAGPASLLAEAQRRMAERQQPNRFVDQLEAGAVPRERLRALAGELYRLVDSDRRSFALLGSRFPAVAGGDLFQTMAQGESQALLLLADFASAVGMSERDLRDYEPSPLAQAYPALLTQIALRGSRSEIALALLANAGGSGALYTRVADALIKQYGLDEKAVGHFRFFAETPPELLDMATATLRSGLAAGDDPQAAVRTTTAVHALEMTFWETLA